MAVTAKHESVLTEQQGASLVPDGTQLSDAKRALLNRYLNGRFPKSSEGAVRIVPRPRGKAVPLSLPQQQVWLHGEMAPDGVPVYNETLTIHRGGSLDHSVLLRTFEEIIRRHEIWRTTFDVVNEQPVQVIHPPSDGFTISTADLRNRTDVDVEEEATRLAGEEARRPFDLKAGPLLRALLVTLRDDDHRLFLTFHQLIFDGVTAYQVFLPEFTAIYDAFSRNEPSPLPEPHLQYADFALWQEEWLKSGAIVRQLAYWQRTLAGPLPELNWPNHRPRPPLQTYRGKLETAAMPKELLDRMKVLSEAQGATLFMTLVAGLAALLYRYTGQEDIILGAPTAGRNIPEVRGMLGYFINLLPLRVDLSGSPTFRELLRRVRETVIGALSNQSVPFTTLLEKVRPANDPSRNPLFQIAISLEPPMPALHSGWTATQSDVPTGASKLDLYIDVDEKPDGISGPVTYNPDVFDCGTIKRMIGHLRTLLDEATRNPDLSVSAARILTDSEQQQFLKWNETRREFPRDKCIHDLFAAQCERTPDAVAVISGEQRLTYDQLNGRANQLANYLGKRGARTETRVALCTERGLDMVVGLLGILKAGAAYVPLDPSFPADRLKGMLADSKPCIVVTQQRLQSLLPDVENVVVLDAERELIERESVHNPDEDSNPEDLAYVIYTSGSTGAPKGVQVEHRSLTNLLLSMQQETGLGPDDVFVAVTTLSFDIAGLEVYLPLISGSKLVIAGSGEVRDGALLLELMSRTGATVLQATPTTWRMLIDAGWSGHSPLKVLCGGEAMPPELGRELTQRSGSVWNVYGPTETTIWSTVYRLAGRETGLIPVGRPVANTQIYILDAHRQPVPVNAVGEIYIGGDGLARGYLGRDDMTSERFVPDPFGDPRARLYRTGDDGRHRADGNIECLGRRDHQVKIRGFRVELGEIEAVLGRQEAIRSCAVVFREHGNHDKQLIAYLELRPGLTPTDAELRTYLKRNLPEYMLPSRFIPMDKLPLSPNGKIDRKALPEPDAQMVSSTAEFVAPRDEFEQVLARIWSKVLAVSMVGVNDNFFDLGGHSLLAVRMMVGIEKVFKKRLPLATLVQSPTIAELASVLRRDNWIPSWSSLVPMRAGGSKAPLFLIHAHGGNVLEYQPLVNRLETDQPVYALQARGLSGSIEPGQTIEGMAGAYIDEMRSLQPAGPYLLGGFCFGGLVALEVAQQLSAAGEQVALLVLIQTMNPDFARFTPETGLLRQWWYRAAKRTDLERENLSHRGIGYFRDRWIDVADVLRARAAIALNTLIGNGHRRNQKMSMRYILESLRIEHAKAYTKYRVRPYHGEVVLLRASKQLAGLMIDETSGWSHIVEGSLDVCEVPGHQQNMLSEPNVAQLARELSLRIKRAQQNLMSKAGKYSHSGVASGEKTAEPLVATPLGV